VTEVTQAGYPGNCRCSYLGQSHRDRGHAF